MARTTTKAEARLQALLEAQGVRPIEDPEQLVFPDWPKDEAVDDFLAAVVEWRREGFD